MRLASSTSAAPSRCARTADRRLLGTITVTNTGNVQRYA